MSIKTLAAIGFTILTWSYGHGQTLASPNNICDQAAEDAARLTRVPVSILKSITRVETGRSDNGHLEPWPWTLNIEGQGVWFSSRDEALEFLEQSLNRGLRSIDVGCFQLNYSWHGSNFQSVQDILNPELNAKYAAGFLRKLHQEKGNWEAAIAAYHSRTPYHARKYLNRYHKIHRDFEEVGNSQTVASVFSGHFGAPSFPNYRVGNARKGSLFPAWAEIQKPNVLSKDR